MVKKRNNFRFFFFQNLTVYIYHVWKFLKFRHFSLETRESKCSISFDCLAWYARLSHRTSHLYQLDTRATFSRVANVLLGRWWGSAENPATNIKRHLNKRGWNLLRELFFMCELFTGYIAFGILLQSRNFRKYCMLCIKVIVTQWKLLES